MSGQNLEPKEGGASADEKTALRVKYHLKGNPTIGLTGATVGFFIGFAAVALFGPTAKKFESLLGLTPLTLGILVAIPNVSGSLLRIPFGAWTDRIGARVPMLTLLGISMVGMVGLTVLLYTSYPAGIHPGDLPLLLLLGALCGAGIAAFPVGINLTSYWTPRAGQGRALGIYAGLGNLAPGIFTLVLPTALVVLGLAGAYFAWFVILALGAVLFTAIARNSFWFQLRRRGVAPAEAKAVAQDLGQEMFPSGSAVTSLKESGRNPRTWALVGLYFTSFGGFLALTAWLPTFWTSDYGFSLVTAAVLTAVGFALLSPLTRVGGGFLSDRIGGENCSVLGFATLLVGAVVVVVAPGAISSFLGVLLIGVGMGLASAGVFRLVAKFVPEAVGGASGWVGGIGAFSGFLLPPVLGEFASAYGKAGYTLGFVVFVGLALFSLAIACVLKFRVDTRSSAVLGEAPSTTDGPAHG
jgi:MFS transporter, NNP family, nitrate/nitrite transporter